MAQAQARLVGLRTSAAKAAAAIGTQIGAALKRVVLLLGTVTAGFAALGAYAVLKNIFTDANEAAQEFLDTQFEIQQMLLNNQHIAEKGMAYSKKQTALLMEYNEQISKEGLLGAQSFDAMTRGLAQVGVAPKTIANSMGIMADVLVNRFGTKAGAHVEEFMKAWKQAFIGGRVQMLKQFIGKIPSDITKAMKTWTPEQVQRYLVGRLVKAGVAGANIRAMFELPGAEQEKLVTDVREMSKRIGLATVAERDKMAKRWRELLPKLEPIFRNMALRFVFALERIAVFIESKLIPNWNDFVKVVSKSGVLVKVADAFKNLFTKGGAALAKFFGITNKEGKSAGTIIGETLVKALDALARVLNYLAENADTVVPLIIALTAAFVAFQAISLAISAAPTVIAISGVAAALAGIAKVASEYNKFHELMAGHAVSDPEHFTTHWYLAGQTWTQMWSGLSAVLQMFIDGWNKSWKELEENIKKAWDMAKKFADWATNWVPPLWLGKFIYRHTAGVRARGAAAGAYGAQMGGAEEGIAAYEAGQTASESAYFARRAVAHETTQGLMGGAAGAGMPTTMTGPYRAGYAGLGGGGVGVTVASYGGPTEPGQVVGAYNNRLGAGDVAISPNLYPILGAPGPGSFLMLDGKRYHIADSSFYTPGHPTSNMVEIWGYGNQIKRAGTAARSFGEGGIVNKPTIAQIGEKGPEAVVPLSKMALPLSKRLLKLITNIPLAEALRVPMAEAYGPVIGEMINPETLGAPTLSAKQQLETFEKSIGGLRGTTDPAKQGLLRRLLADPEYLRLKASEGAGGHTVHFTPNITINGGATEEQQRAMDKSLRTLARDFVEEFKRAQRHERRLSYEGGYS